VFYSFTNVNDDSFTVFLHAVCILQLFIQLCL
jgi:hypothetical protein